MRSSRLRFPLAATLLLGIAVILSLSGGSPSSPSDEAQPTRARGAEALALPAITPTVSAIGTRPRPSPRLLPLLPSRDAGTPGTSSRAYGCPSGACPRSLEYAVNGCTCAGDVYEESEVDAGFCCSFGFSYEECPESLSMESDLEWNFGYSQDEVESQLVWVELQGWYILVHDLAAEAFREANRNVEGVNYVIWEEPEAYSWRAVEGHNVMSTHSFGIAVDVNPSANPSCGVTEACYCYNDLITDMPSEFVQAFKDAGFEWGGDWEEHPDPMHFEWAAWR
jgi:hypothetical protein